MRIILPLVAAAVVLAGAMPRHAQAQSGILGQAQRYLGTGNNTGNNDSRDAYERGRQDEMRRSQAETGRQHQYREPQEEHYRRGSDTPYSEDRGYGRTYNR